MNKIKHFRQHSITLFTVLLILTFIFADVTPFGKNLNSVSAAAIKLSSTKVTLVKGQTKTLKLQGAKKKAKWSSSNKSIASVSSKGKVTAKNKGKARITAKLGKKKYNCIVTVETPKLNKTSLSIRVGQYYQLKLSGTSQKIKWSSKNRTIAGVSSKGKIVGRKEGTVYILARVSNKDYKCKVRVYPKRSEEQTPGNNIPDSTNPGTSKPEDTPSDNNKPGNDSSNNKPGSDSSSDKPGNNDPSNDKPGNDDSSLKNNLKKLQDHIDASSHTDDDGNKYIIRDTTVNGNRCQYRIIHKKGSNQLQYAYAIETGSNGEGITMDTDILQTDTVSPEYLIVNKSTLSITCKANATFKASSYSGSKVTFEITKNSTDHSASTIKNKANDVLKDAFSSWQKLLKDETGMTLSDVGFSSYH